MQIRTHHYVIGKCNSHSEIWGYARNPGSDIAPGSQFPRIEFLVVAELAWRNILALYWCVAKSIGPTMANRIFLSHAYSVRGLPVVRARRADSRCDWPGRNRVTHRLGRCIPLYKSCRIPTEFRILNSFPFLNLSKYYRDVCYSFTPELSGQACRTWC